MQGYALSDIVVYLIVALFGSASVLMVAKLTGPSQVPLVARSFSAESILIAVRPSCGQCQPHPFTVGSDLAGRFCAAGGDPAGQFYTSAATRLADSARPAATWLADSARSAVIRLADFARPVAAVPQSLWLNNYAKAMTAAEKQNKMLLIYFCDRL